MTAKQFRCPDSVFRAAQALQRALRESPDSTVYSVSVMDSEIRMQGDGRLSGGTERISEVVDGWKARYEVVEAAGVVCIGVTQIP
jgi:hypothetical protein